jgi:hypothetical protein
MRRAIRTVYDDDDMEAARYLPVGDVIYRS